MVTTMSTSILMNFKVKLCNVCGNCYGSAILKDIQVSSSFNYNLFSINRLLKDGFTLSGKDSALPLIHTSDKRSRAFNIKIHTKSSYRLAAYMQRITQGKVAAISTENSPSLSLNEVHRLFGHHNENRTQEIVKALGIFLTKGPMNHVL